MRKSRHPDYLSLLLWAMLAGYIVWFMNCAGATAVDSYNYYRGEVVVFSYQQLWNWYLGLLAVSLLAQGVKAVTQAGPGLQMVLFSISRICALVACYIIIGLSHRDGLELSARILGGVEAFILRDFCLLFCLDEKDLETPSERTRRIKQTARWLFYPAALIAISIPGVGSWLVPVVAVVVFSIWLARYQTQMTQEERPG